MRWSLALLVVAATLASACTAEEPPTPSIPDPPRVELTSDDLAGTEWVLVQVDGRSWDLENDPEVTLSFDDRRLGGFNGCNEYGARWTVHGKQLHVGGIGQTQILCRGDAAMVERRMNQILGGSPTITPTGDDLRLTALPEGVLVFQPAA